MLLTQLVVAPSYFLGRSVSQRKAARWASNNNKLKSSSLHPKSNEATISVDKLLHAPPNHPHPCTFDKEHERIANLRDGIFYGWGYFTSEAITSNTPCTVEPDPIPDNPNHVLIQFPEIVRSCKEKRNKFAQMLANVSKWLEYRTPFHQTDRNHPQE